MDAAEALTEKFLQHRNFTSIVYEPDGNVPPDFLVEGNIAIEVRRLIQHEDSTGRDRGITETAIPLLAKLQALLASLGAPNAGKSWFVAVRFSRPLEDWRTLRPRLHAWLEAFKNGSQTEGAARDFGDGFTVQVALAAAPHAQLFLLGIFTDFDSGGWLLAELQRNLDICIAEKTRKIAGVRLKYPTWWLVFVDHIGLALDEFDRVQFREVVSLVHTWDKVILLNPGDPTHWFEC